MRIGVPVKTERVVAQPDLPLEFEILGFEFRLEMAAEDDPPAGGEKTSFFDHLEGIPLLEKLVGRVEKNEVEPGPLPGQLDHRPIEFHGHDPGPVFGLQFRQIVPEGADRDGQDLNEDGERGAVAEGFNTDRTRPGESVQDGQALKIFPQDIEKGGFEFVRIRTDHFMGGLPQAFSFIDTADDSDHCRRAFLFRPDRQ